jgi:excinuclease UvrABC nuclease subunit
MIVIDGGEAQLAVAREVLVEKGLGIGLVAVVKDTRHRPDHFLGEVELVERFKKELLLVNAEAHRFALTFHKKRRAKAFLG